MSYECFQDQWAECPHFIKSLVFSRLIALNEWDACWQASTDGLEEYLYVNLHDYYLIMEAFEPDLESLTLRLQGGDNCSVIMDVVIHGEVSVHLSKPVLSQGIPEGYFEVREWEIDMKSDSFELYLTAQNQEWIRFLFKDVKWTSAFEGRLPEFSLTISPHRRVEFRR